MGHYEWELCPHCNKRISDVRRGVASDTTVGSEVIRCPHCSGLIRTGKTEWPDKSKIAKAGYYIRVAWWCLGAVFIGGFGTLMAVLFIAGVLMRVPIERILPIAAVLGIIGAALAVIMVIHSVKRQINESMERTSR